MVIALCIDCDRETYAAYVLDNTIIVCSFDFYVSNQLANRITYPVRDLAVSESCSASLRIQEPEKSASAKTSSPYLYLGEMISPFSRVCRRYLAK